MSQIVLSANIFLLKNENERLAEVLINYSFCWGISLLSSFRELLGVLRSYCLTFVWQPVHRVFVNSWIHQTDCNCMNASSSVNPSPPLLTGRRLPLLPVSLICRYPTMSLQPQSVSKPQDHTLCFIDGKESLSWKPFWKLILLLQEWPTPWWDEAHSRTRTTKKMESMAIPIWNREDVRKLRALAKNSCRFADLCIFSVFLARRLQWRVVMHHIRQLESNA